MKSNLPPTAVHAAIIQKDPNKPLDDPDNGEVLSVPAATLVLVIRALNLSAEEVRRVANWMEVSQLQQGAP